MAAPTDTFVDPSIAAASGSGTLIDPYGDVQHDLDTIVRDATNGDRIYVKEGTDEILTGALDLSTYGTPTVDAPLIFEGYRAVQGDGGIGGISGNGSFSVINSGTLDYIQFINMHLHNSGANPVVKLDNSCWLINCEIDTTSSNGVDMDNEGGLVNCYVHDTTAEGIIIEDGSVLYSSIRNCGAGVETTGVSFVAHNVILPNVGGDGVRILQDGAVIIGNTIFNTNSTNGGIDATSGAKYVVILNNIIEGYSGIGGDGVEVDTGARLILYGHNAFFNNTTHRDINGDVYVNLQANDQILTASPFTDAAGDDFTVDTTVQALAYLTANFPNLSIRSFIDIGGLQRQESAGGNAGDVHLWWPWNPWKHT